jgi:hypothetical protein
MITIVALLTFAWIAFWAFKAAQLAIKGWKSSIIAVFVVHAVLCGLPLLLDVVIGKPEYSGYPGIAIAANDDRVYLLYSLYVASCPILWWWLWRRSLRVRGRSSNLSPGSPLHQSRRKTLQYLPIVVLPLLLLPFAPNPKIYLSYTPFQRYLYTQDEAAFYHVLITHATSISLLCITLILLRTCNLLRAAVILSPFIFLDFWLHGKRNIVAIGIVLLFYVIWKKHLLTGRRLYLAGVMGVLIFISFSILYQTKWRFSQEFAQARTLNYWYENARIDFGRDDVIKLALLAELEPEKFGILDYRGQSLMIYLTAPIPRRFWQEKPASYPYRITASAEMRPLRSTGGALTTSVFDEAVANCGWWGMILGPMILWWICRLGDSCRNQTISALTILVVCLIQSTHLLAVIIYVGLWVILVARAKVHKMLRINQRFFSRADSF